MKWTSAEDIGIELAEKFPGGLPSEQDQDAFIKDMVFSVAELIAYCSTFTPLNPGDVIAAGTPSISACAAYPASGSPIGCCRSQRFRITTTAAAGSPSSFSRSPCSAWINPHIPAKRCAGSRAVAPRITSSQ